MAVAEKRAKVCELAAEGMTEREIAAATGISKSRVHAILAEAPTLILAPAVESLRAASTKRLGKYLEALEPATKAGEPEAIRV